MKCKNDMVVPLLVIGALLVFTGVLKLGGTGQTQSIITTGQQSTAAAGAPFIGDDNLADLQVRVKNPLDSGASYTSPGVTLINAETNQRISAYGTSTAGSFTTNLTNVLAGGRSYKLGVVNSGAAVGVMSPAFTPASAVVEKELSVANSSEVEFAVFSSNYANQTAGFVQDGVGNITDSLGANGVLTKIVRYRALTGTAQFGSDELNAYVCADFSLSRFSKTNGITVDRSDWTSSDLPKRCASQGYDKAWRIPPVKSSDGERDVKITFRSDLGDPVSADSNPRFLMVDEAYYVKGDGTVAVGTEDDSAADVGETNRYIDASLA